MLIQEPPTRPFTGPIQMGMTASLFRQVGIKMWRGNKWGGAHPRQIRQILLAKKLKRK